MLQSNLKVQITDKNNKVDEPQDTVLSGRIQTLKGTLYDLIYIKFTSQLNYFLLIEI